MKFDPAAATTTIPDGEYDAEISNAEETKSKAGNDMIKLTVKVWAGGGGPRVVFDYVVNPNSLWRLKQIATATNQLPAFEAGDIGSAQIIGKSVRVALKTQKQVGFDDKNVITRYLHSDAGPRDSVETPPASDDDINF